MKIRRLKIKDVCLLEPLIHSDQRGYFYESYNQRKFNEATGISCEFVQDNQSFGKKGVLRGLHYQLPPNDQGKLVRVTEGSIIDVAVDIRKNSPTFMEYVCSELSSKNHCQMWIPSGFAHGFIITSDTACVMYKTTKFYSFDDERSIFWNDKTLNIEWPKEINPILSGKDSLAPQLKDAQLFNK